MNNNTNLPAGDTFGWVKFRINSGAEAVRSFWLDASLVGGTTVKVVTNVTAEAGTDLQRTYINGDTFYLFTPSTIQPATLAQVFQSLVVNTNNTTTTINIDLIEMGYIDQSIS